MTTMSLAFSTPPSAFSHRIPAEDRPEGDTIFLPGTGGGGRIVPAVDILAIVSAENYSEVLLQNGERWLLRRTMHAWEQVLPDAVFVRVHRCVIVNLQRIERIERNRDENTWVLLRGHARPFPVGRRVWPRLKARFYLNQFPPTLVHDEPPLACVGT